ncbi:MAG TPA: hypothetical protein VF765_13470 [Polyangiaceae bacterium]
MRFWLRCASYLLVLALAMLVHAFSAPRFTSVEMREGNEPWHHAELPVGLPSTRGVLEVRAHLVVSRIGPRSITIVPDDHFQSLSIDGVDVSLAGVPPAKLADWQDGFRLRIARYVHLGDNVLVARVRNEGGPGGLDLREDPYDWIELAELGVGLAAFLALGAELLRRLSVGWPMVTVALTAVVVRAAYLSVTPFNVRHHDAFQHLDYIEYLLAHHRLPGAEEGYMFFQPPLYYVVNALQWSALQALGVGRSAILWSLQLQSLLFELGFALLAIATANLWMQRERVRRDGRGATSSESWTNAQLGALVLLWPASIVHAVRIGNDDLAYLFLAASFFFTSRWWVHGVRRDLVWASLLAALGVVTKVNDLVAFAVLLLAILGRLVLLERERRIGEYLRRGWIAAACLVVSVTAALGVGVRDWLAGRREHLLVSDINQNPAGLLVGNHLKNYVWLDVPNFLKQPFTSPWDDGKGRQWFWNYVLKTSLFGEFDYAQPWLRALAVLIGVLLLALLVQLVAGALLMRRREWLDGMPLVALAVLFLASLMALRISAPNSCSNDFRYILPVVLPCACAYVWFQVRCRERGWRIIPLASAVLGWLFALSSAAYFLLLSLAGD